MKLFFVEDELDLLIIGAFFVSNLDVTSILDKVLSDDSKLVH